MKQTISVRIDVSKIDKARLYKGDKGTYLDAVILLNTESDQYGQNGMILQQVSKEERESGVKGNILGNVKILNSQLPSTAQPRATAKDDDGLPDWMK